MYNNKDRRTAKKKSPKQSSIKIKQQIAYSLFKAKVEMSKTDFSIGIMKAPFKL